MVMEHDSLIAEYQHEMSRFREAEALHTLRKVASLVKPIMRQRGWRVGILAEFFPAEQNLLGLNYDRGQKICLRLRHAGDERQFIPIEQVLDTMLHELCHNVHGPHNEAFNNLWNQLRDEHESLVRKGYTGEGFLSVGHKLGGQRIPMHEARRQARAAAERRRILTAGSGQKLGGAPVRRGADIRKIIADAAQRRVTVTKGCASEGTTKQREQEIIDSINKTSTRTKAEADDPNEEAIMIAYIDLIQEEERQKYGDAYIPPSKENPLGSQGAPIHIRPDNDTPPVPTSTKPSAPKLTRLPQRDSSNKITSLPKPTPPPPPPPPPPPSSSWKDETWTCEICTLVNPSTYLCCDACTTERPSPPSSPDAPLRTNSTTNTSKSKPLGVKTSNPTPTTNSHQHSSLTDSNSKKAVRSLINLEATSNNNTSSSYSLPNGQNQKQWGWTCHSCGNWMEAEWWTCATCGSMKLNS